MLDFSSLEPGQAKGEKSEQEKKTVSTWDVNKDVLLANALLYWRVEGGGNQGGNFGPVVCVNLRADADWELTCVRHRAQPFPIIVSFNPTYEEALLLPSFYQREKGDTEH